MRKLTGILAAGMLAAAGNAYAEERGEQKDTGAGWHDRGSRDRDGISRPDNGTGGIGLGTSGQDDWARAGASPAGEGWPNSSAVVSPPGPAVGGPPTTDVSGTSREGE